MQATFPLMRMQNYIFYTITGLDPEGVAISI